MPYGEQYQPNGSEKFCFKIPDVYDELLASELEIDQPYELEMYMQKLKAEYSEEIAQKIPFLARGIMVKPDEFSIEEQDEIFHGRIDRFELQELLGQYRIIARLKNDETEETRSMVISGREGYESALLSDNLHDDKSDEVRTWEKIRAKCFDAAELLGTVATELAFRPFNASSVDTLDAIEEILADDYNIRQNKFVFVEGTQIYETNDEPIIIQNRHSLAGEGSYSGKFLGLTFYELTTTRDRAERRLCVALLLDDNRVVLQPCHTAHRVENLEAH